MRRSPAPTRHAPSAKQPRTAAPSWTRRASTPTTPATASSRSASAPADLRAARHSPRGIASGAQALRPEGDDMAADIVIKGGTVIDGTGAPGVQADVAVSDGTIVEVGTGLSGERELDASGQVVAPGFIDIHSHYDAQVFWDPALTPSVFHGVTTVIAGNCGFSIAPVRQQHVGLLARTLQHVEDMSLDTLSVGVPWDEF